MIYRDLQKSIVSSCFKWKEKKTKFASSFLEAYPNHKTAVISRSDFEHFIGL